MQIGNVLFSSTYLIFFKKKIINFYYSHNTKKKLSQMKEEKFTDFNNKP